jgi:CHAT domain-containing protein
VKSDLVSTETDLNMIALQRAFSVEGDRDEALSIARLPFTRREAESIFLNAPAGSSRKVLDFNASRETILNADLSKYRIIHFATHGILHSEHPELSGIVLSLVNERANR